MIHRVPDAESTAAVSQPREPQGWRLLPPPELLAHNAMPVTANMAVQRSLAAHIPVSQLAATSRPLGHERRADGPIGTVASVLRMVSASAGALLPVTHIAGSDLVLRRKTAASEGPLTEDYPTPTSPARPSTNKPVDRSFQSSPSPASLRSGSEAGREPPTEPMALRALGVTSPLLSDFTPATSLTSALSFAAPSLAGSAASSLIARSPGDPGTSASPSDMPVAARQRRVIEVRSANEPVSLSAFEATASPSPSSVVARTADGTAAPFAESAQVAPRSPSGEDGEGEFEATAGPSTSPLPEILPTVGRRIGLGMPMNALPPSAISRLPESDPFAGWNESEMPLAPGSSSSTGSAEGGVGGVTSATAGEGVRGITSASGGPDSTSVRRSADRASPGPSAPSSPHAAARGATYLDADGSTSTDPESPAAPALVLSGLVEHAPLVGHRRLDRSLDESLAPVSVAGTERGVTSVRVRWGTGSDSPNPGTHENAGAGPGALINRSVDAPSDSSSPAGSGRDNRTHSGSRESMVTPTASPNVSRLPSTGPVASGHTPSALSPQRSTEPPGWSPAPLAPAGSAQRSPAGSGSPTSPGTANATTTRVESSGGSAGASESSQVRTGERSEDEPAVPLRQWQDTHPVPSLLVIGSGAAIGREAGPLLRTPDPSAGRATTLPVVNVNRAAAQASSTAALMLQREPQLGATQASGQSNNASPSSEQANGDPETAPTPASNGGGESTAGGDESAAGGAAGASGPTSAQADAELDRLAGKLYERIRQRVRRELLDDRERAGFALDGMR